MEIIGDLSRRRAEALALEIRQLAKRYGVEVEVRCRMARATAEAPRTSAQ
jgi:flagellar biosynthesis protein FlhB